MVLMWSVGQSMIRHHCVASALNATVMSVQQLVDEGAALSQRMFNNNSWYLNLSPLVNKEETWECIQRIADLQLCKFQFSHAERLACVAEFGDAARYSRWIKWLDDCAQPLPDFAFDKTPRGETETYTISGEYGEEKQVVTRKRPVGPAYRHILVRDRYAGLEVTIIGNHQYKGYHGTVLATTTLGSHVDVRLEGVAVHQQTRVHIFLMVERQ